jgi:hypothetical protein
MPQLWARLGTWNHCWFAEFSSDCVACFQQGIPTIFLFLFFSQKWQVLEGIKNNAPKQQDNVLIEYPSCAKYIFFEFSKCMNVHC